MTDQISREQTTLAAIEDSLQALEDLLEAERAALLKADAGAVTVFAHDKERLAAAVERLRQTPEGLAALMTPRLRQTAHRVAGALVSNHELLRVMYEQWSGMMELIRRRIGQTGTYGRNGQYQTIGLTAGGRKATL